MPRGGHNSLIALQEELQRTRVALRQVTAERDDLARQKDDHETRFPQGCQGEQIIMNVTAMCAPDCQCRDASTGLAHSMKLVPRDQAVMPWSANA